MPRTLLETHKHPHGASCGMKPSTFMKATS